MFSHSTRRKKRQYLCNNCHPADCKQTCELVRTEGSYLCIVCNAGIVVTYDRNHPGIEPERERVTDLDTANRMINLLRKRVEFYKQMCQRRAEEITLVKERNKALKEDLRDYVAGLCDLCGKEMNERLASSNFMSLEEFQAKYEL